MASGDLRGSERRSIQELKKDPFSPDLNVSTGKKKMCNQKLENYVVGIFLFGFCFFCFFGGGGFPPPTSDQGMQKFWNQGSNPWYSSD